MKKPIALIIATFASFSATNARADLVFVEEFDLIADRETLSFRVTMDESEANFGKNVMKVVFGRGIAQLETTIMLGYTGKDASKARFGESLKKFLDYFNNQDSQILSIADALKLTDWKTED